MILIKEMEKQATYYRKQQKVYQYAMEFWKEIVACGDRMEVNDDVLPIQCYNEIEAILEAMECGNKTKMKGNVTSFKNKQAVIRIAINGDNDRLSAPLKRTIRHEVIHYFLWLMEMPHADDSLEFWCLCYAFDGGAYQELSDSDKKKYNLYTKVFDDYIAPLPDNVKKIIISSALSHINNMNAEEYENNIKADIEKLRMMFRFK